MGVKAWILVAALVPLSALGQEAGPGQAAPPMPDDPRAPRYREVERGFYVGFEAGWLTFLETHTAEPARFPSYARNGGGRSDQLLVGVNTAYDVTDRLALGLFALGANGGASSSYGSFSVFAAGADVRLSLFGVRDGQGVERLFGYVHGRGGWLVTRPVGLFGNTDLLAGGGLGLEYFTRLRHFSVGISLDGVYVSKAATAGFTLSPTVRYTF